MANRKQKSPTANPWEGVALIDHGVVHRQRLELCVALAEIVARPELDESIAEEAAAALPGLLSEEVDRFALMEQISRAERHPHLKVETA